MNIEHFMPSFVSVEQVDPLWEQNDILIFIIDLKDYATLNADYLDEVEKEHLDKLQTGYFKKRYITSRTVLKYLSGILKKQSLSNIAMYKDERGRVHVQDHNDLYICISYTENLVALAISKIEMGIDIEVVKRRSLANIIKSINSPSTDSGVSANSYDFLVMWTLKEAYCKFSNETMLSNLSKKLDLCDVCHSSYFICGKYILAVVTNSDPYKVGIVNLQPIYFDIHTHN